MRLPWHCCDTTFIWCFIKLLNKFNHSLTKFVQFYREKNPGFNHNDYLIRPSNALLKSVHSNINKFQWIEFLYRVKCCKFMTYNNLNVKQTYFPWYKNISLLTPYNTVYVKEDKMDEFINYLDRLNICVVKNPTYKIFDHEYKNKEKDKKFNNSLLYIPSLGGMTDKELLYLSEVLDDFLKQKLYK